MFRVMLLIIWVVMAIIGLWGFGARFITGHQLAAYGNYIPWGLWVAAYIYFIGLSAGSFVLASVVYVGRVKILEPVGPLALFSAIVTLIMALLSIAMDLGHMNRSSEVMLHANFRSMMAWMIFLYSTYMGVIVIENVLAMVPRLKPYRGQRNLRGFLAAMITRIPEKTAEHWLHRLGMVGVPLAIAFHGGVGALFATVGARPYWHQPLFPIIFLVGALVSGCGLLAWVYFVIWPQRDENFRKTMIILGKMVLGLLLFDTLLEWAEFSIPLWQGISHEAEIFRDLLYGHYWYNFWIVHLLLGVLVPAALLIFWGKRPGAIGFAGGLVAATFIGVRLNLVIPPQTQPHLEGLAEAFVSPRAAFDYFPTYFEWAVLAGVCAVGTGVFMVGIKLLPVLPERQPESERPGR